MEEFAAIWFESGQEWVVVFAAGGILRDGYGSIGSAIVAAFDHIGLGESDFDCTEDTGTFYRYERALS